MTQSARNLVFTLMFAAVALPRVGDSQANAAARHELLQQATAASQANDHQRAVELAERAAALGMSTSLRSFLAFEYAQVGRLSLAMDFAEQCIREATANSALEQRAAILTTCQRVELEMASRVGHLTINIHDPPQGTRIAVASQDVPSALWGVPYIVTPGQVHVEATAPGYVAFRTDVPIQAGANGEVTVSLVAQPAEPARSEAQPPPPHHEEAHRSSVLPAVGVVVLGAGVLGLVGSLVTLILGNSAASTFESQQCPSSDHLDCFDTTAARQQLNGVTTLYSATDVLFGAGIGLAVIGAGTFLISRVIGSGNERQTVRVAPTLLPGGLGIGLAGSL